jgi:hypothetical protein
LHIFLHSSIFLGHILYTFSSFFALVKASPAKVFFYISLSTCLPIVTWNFVCCVTKQAHAERFLLRAALKQSVTRHFFPPPESIYKYKYLGQVGDPHRLNFFPERRDTLAPISSHDFPSGVAKWRRLFVALARSRARV